MTIKVSHESPIALLPQSVEYNDYQYCLVHLMEEQDEYKEWFLEKYRAKVPNGEILLDNSIFELKEAFDSEKYAVWCEKIQPNYYIVPDVLENGPATISNFSIPSFTPFTTESIISEVLKPLKVCTNGANLSSA